MEGNRPRLSVVVPLRDEEDVLPTLAARLLAVLESLEGDWEVVLVDDGSTDGTYGLAVALHTRDSRFKVLRLSRGFGHQVALTAGLDAARGNAVLTMDGDLQHPPEVIPDLVARCESRFKDWTARAFYRLLGRLADIDVPAAAGDFRLVDRSARRPPARARRSLDPRCLQYAPRRVITAGMVLTMIEMSSQIDQFSR